MSRNLDADFDYSDDVEIEVDEYADEVSVEDYKSLGIDPFRPTVAKPGSEDKVIMLSARYAAGVPLWNNDDCYDHGPSGSSEFDDMFADDDIEEDEEI
jgi:hypothetical protein